MHTINEVFYKLIQKHSGVYFDNFQNRINLALYNISAVRYDRRYKVDINYEGQLFCVYPNGADELYDLLNKLLSGSIQIIRKDDLNILLSDRNTSQKPERPKTGFASLPIRILSLIGGLFVLFIGIMLMAYLPQYVPEDPTSANWKCLIPTGIGIILLGICMIWHFFSKDPLSELGCISFFIGIFIASFMTEAALIHLYQMNRTIKGDPIPKTSNDIAAAVIMFVIAAFGLFLIMISFRLRKIKRKKNKTEMILRRIPFFSGMNEARRLYDELMARTMISAVLASYRSDRCSEECESSFGGVPYWEGGEEYPTDETGKQMVFLCRFELSKFDSSQRLPDSGMLQFYISQNLQSCRVVYHKRCMYAMTKSELKEHGINVSEYTKGYPIEFSSLPTCISSVDPQADKLLHETADSLGITIDKTAALEDLEYYLGVNNEDIPLEDDRFATFLLGRESWSDYCIGERSSEYDTLLLQLSRYDLPPALYNKLPFFDRLCFYIREDDLKQCIFDDINIIISY